MPRPKGSKGHTDVEELFLRRCVPAPCKYPELGDCWIWTGAVVKDPRKPGGDPRPQCNGNTYGTRYSHQWSCHHWNGSPLPIEPGMCIRHKCDTPLCVNPEHLQYGTWKENFDDMYVRNPTSLGRIAPTDEQLAIIKRMKEEGKSEYVIQKEFPERSRTWVRRIMKEL